MYFGARGAAEPLFPDADQAKRVKVSRGTEVRQLGTVLSAENLLESGVRAVEAVL